MIPNLPQTSRAALTPAQAKTLDAAAAIRQAPDATEAAFMASIGTMPPPHANPGKVEAWTRRSGDLTLVLQAGWDGMRRRTVRLGTPMAYIPVQAGISVAAGSRRTGRPLEGTKGNRLRRAHRWRRGARCPSCRHLSGARGSRNLVCRPRLQLNHGIEGPESTSRMIVSIVYRF